MALTLMFIFAYKAIPINDYKDFIIYILGILYAFVFFVIGIFQSAILNSYEKNYNTLKSKYESVLELSHMHLMALVSSKELLKYINTDKLHNRLENIPSLNLRYYITEKKDVINNFSIDSSVIDFSKWYIALEKFISSKQWDESKMYTKIMAHVYYMLQKRISKKFEVELRRTQNIFGDRLINDIINEKNRVVDTDKIFFLLDNIQYDLEDIKLLLDDYNNRASQ